MTRDDLIDYCLTFPSVYEDYPFGVAVDNGAWTVMRHLANKKSFALIYERSGSLCVNLKCEPFQADFFRQVYKDVTPAFHMNKEHWNTITIGGDVPDQELLEMIQRSYDLIKPKLRTVKSVVVEVDKDTLWPNNLYRDVFGEPYENIPENAEAAIEFVLNMLKPREKAIVLARLRDYKTFTAIAKEYNRSCSLIAHNYHRAIRRIRRHPLRPKYLIDLDGQLKRDLAAEEDAKELRRQAMEKSKTQVVKAAWEEITIDDLDLSVRAYNCLSRVGIRTLADISMLTSNELIGVRNLGRKCYLEVLDVCEKYGVILDEGIR